MLFNPKVKEGEPTGQDEEASPFMMMVLAIVCQVKVSKYSEFVV